MQAARSPQNSERPIFISYRRDDCEADAGRLCQSLRQAFGDDRIFLDTEHVRPGTDFVDCLDETLHSASSMVVVIGPAWTAGCRLSDRSDWVRLEIETALRLGIRILPLLVRGASLTVAELPLSMRKLARKQSTVAEHSSWDQDLARLIDELGRDPDASDGHHRPGALRVPSLPEAFIVRHQSSVVELDVLVGSCEFSILHTPGRFQIITNDSLDIPSRCELLGKKMSRGAHWSADQFKVWTNQSFRISAEASNHVGYYASRVSYRKIHGWKLVLDEATVLADGDAPPSPIDLVWW